MSISSLIMFTSLFSFLPCENKEDLMQCLWFRLGWKLESSSKTYRFLISRPSMVMKLTPQYCITKFNLMSSVILLDEILSHSYIHMCVYVFVCVIYKLKINIELIWCSIQVGYQKLNSCKWKKKWNNWKN